jgi:hypothetical protein
MQGSLVDYDGDGDMEEGIQAEIVGLQEAVFAGIQAYAAKWPAHPLSTIPKPTPISSSTPTEMEW